MKEVSVRLENGDGMHARPAAIFVRRASQFQSKIELEGKGQKKNGKSIMGLMGLGLEKGDDIILRADGEDESQALDALQTLIKNNFEEA